MPRLVLASGSPRRRELLAAVGLDFEVRPADLDEAVRPGEAPRPYVERLAREKAAAVGADGEVVLAADTTVDLDGTILGKPVDAADAVAMLQRLRGRTHHVHTGVAVRSAEGTRSIVVSTAVTFFDATDAFLEWYVGTGEPLDKAGAYAIQGQGRALVERVEGSESNVIGLPLEQTLELLWSVGFTVDG